MLSNYWYQPGDAGQRAGDGGAPVTADSGTVTMAGGGQGWTGAGSGGGAAAVAVPGPATGYTY